MNKTCYTLFGFFVLLICGCDLTVPVELPPHESKLILNAILHPQDPTVIYVSQSKGILENNSIFTDPLTRANVTIIENGIALPNPTWVDTTIFINPGSEQFNVQGYYLPGFIPKPTATYRITVSNPSLKNVEATITLPETPVISPPIWERDVLRDQQGELVSVLRLKIDDPPGEKNHYSIELTGKYVDPSNPQDFRILPVAFQNGSLGPNTGNPLNVLYFNDELFDGENAEQEIFFRYFPTYFETGERGYMTKLYIRFRSTDESFYKFHQDLQKHQATKDVGFSIFAGEPISVHSNVDGGYGIVAGFVEVRDTL